MTIRDSKQPGIRSLLMGMIALVTVHGLIVAQEGLNKEVSVVRPYSPSVVNAVKTRLMPKLDDSVHAQTYFDYYIQPARINPQLRVRGIEAAEFRPEGKENLKPSIVTLGLGNYWTPMGKLSIHTLSNPKTSLGVDMSHLSSQGFMKMADERKTYAGYAYNDVKFCGQQYLKNSTFTSDFYFNEDHHFLYGYSTDSLNDGTPVTPLNLRMTQRDSVPVQRFVILGSRLSLQSDRESRQGWQYRIDGQYDFLISGRDSLRLGQDTIPDTKEMEHEGQLDFALSKSWDKISVGGEIGADYVYRTYLPDSLNYVVAYADPWIGFNWRYIKLTAGPKVAMGRNAEKFFIYPRVKLEFNITDLLVPYVGLNGYYENHTLRSVSRENPYMVDNQLLKPTHHRFIAYGGLRGRFSPMVAFNLAVSWEDADSLLFFVPDRANPKLNTFNVVYDNGSILQMGGEISLRQSDNLSYILKGNYYQYDLDTLAAPWHKPAWDLNFTARYAWKKKLMVKTELFLLGKSRVPDPDPAISAPMELDGLVDINLAAEYRILTWLSVFAQVNNLVSDKYYIWQNYPMQGINFLAGLSCIF